MGGLDLVDLRFEGSMNNKKGRISVECNNRVLLALMCITMTLYMRFGIG
jgi:hypothetical protein